MKFPLIFTLNFLLIIISHCQAQSSFSAFMNELSAELIEIEQQSEQSFLVFLEDSSNDKKSEPYDQFLKKNDISDKQINTFIDLNNALTNKISDLRKNGHLTDSLKSFQLSKETTQRLSEANLKLQIRKENTAADTTTSKHLPCYQRYEENLLNLIEQATKTKQHNAMSPAGYSARSLILHIQYNHCLDERYYK